MADARLVLSVLALVLAMVLAGVHGLQHRVGIAILALLSVSWFTLDRLFEGDVILKLSGSHGLTTSDFGGLAGLVAVAWLWRRDARRRRAPHARPVADEATTDRVSE